ncbi:hypothetical protein QYE76_065493 [Lolium multiflorum]|uniref:CCHC-type domain-containing protein n=1 Tax=Lolium multiflorum TaxID=4521 RepID=A0AAD8W8Y4_LOLMU|nr:hypothetical protein QYE76_065493 [Lolium multiflorum]
MTGHAKKLSDLGIVIPNRLGINRVLQSLPPSYKNFVMNYNMQNMNKEFPELFGMLKAAEIEIKKEHQVLMVNKTTSFKKQGKSKGKNKKSGKKAATPPVKPKSGPKPDAECYYCKEKGHWKRNCSKYLADLKSGLVKKKKEGMEHWTAVKNILKYLKRTKDMFLCYGGDQELVVTSYTDASWNTDPDDSKSQSGYVFILNGAAVSWASSKQCTVAKSSTESEYIAASEASSKRALQTAPPTGRPSPTLNMLGDLAHSCQRPAVAGLAICHARGLGALPPAPRVARACHSPRSGTRRARTAPLVGCPTPPLARDSPRSGRLTPARLTPSQFRGSLLAL